MPIATWDQKPIENIRVEQLDIKPGEFKGEWIKGGPLQQFSSTGIIDKASKVSLTVVDGCIVVDTINTKAVTGDVTFAGDTTFKKDVFVGGKLEVDQLITKQLIADQQTDKQFIEFTHKNNRKSNVGTGFLWTAEKGFNKQFIYRNNPDRFWSTEPIDIPPDKGYMIDGLEVVTRDTLGASVVKSSLREVGQLKNLVVQGRLQVAENLFYDPNLDRLSLGTDKPAGDFTIFNFENDTNFIIDSEDGDSKLGTYNSKSLRIITSDQTRIKVSFKGDVTVGNEGTDTQVHRLWGKVGIGIKNPEHSLEVSGDIKFQNRLHTVGSKHPANGHWNTGDVIWNDAPKKDAPIGWVCTKVGTPGWWAPFGFIGSNIEN